MTTPPPTGVHRDSWIDTIKHALAAIPKWALGLGLCLAITFIGTKMVMQVSCEGCQKKNSEFEARILVLENKVKNYEILLRQRGIDRP